MIDVVRVRTFVSEFYVKFHPTTAVITITIFAIHF